MLDRCLLGFDVTYFCGHGEKFYRNLFPSILKMDIACYLITLVPLYRITWWQTPQDCNLKRHIHSNYLVVQGCLEKL